jgi:Rv0078B-related antitoxin
MDRLLRDDLELSRKTEPAEKLAQALEMMAAGIRLKRSALRDAQPGATESEIDAELERWLIADA